MKKASLTIFLLITLSSLLIYGRARAQEPAGTPLPPATESPVAPPGEAQAVGTEPPSTPPAGPPLTSQAVTLPPATEAPPPEPEPQDLHEPGAPAPDSQPEAAASVEVLVQFDSMASLEAVQAALEQYGVVQASGLSQIGVLRLQVPQAGLEETLAEMSGLPGVILAETNDQMLRAELTPNDLAYGQQYALPLIHAPQAWDISTGSSSVVIAVLDSGVNSSHPDLAGKFVAGYDVLERDDIPQDNYGHGTHVAGIAAAMTNNASGVAGVDWQARIMPVRVLDSSGQGTNADAAEGIIWATNHGAQVINLSLGGEKADPVLEAAVNYAYSRGVVLVASAGNISNGTSAVYFPAAYPQVIAVAACDQASQWAAYSRYGPEVDVTAPGSNIYSTWPGNGYNTLSGTSMASPFVAGEAALLRSVNASLSPDQVASLIRTYTLNLGAPGWDMYTGSGLVQLDLALLAARPTAEPVIEPDAPGSSRSSGRGRPTPTPTSTPTPTPTPSATPTPGL